jgi:ubiquinone/menaquinone biosynthesis C-methylase UbiE
MAVSQFGEPRGPKGWLAAHVVARLTGDANRWMVDCLAVGGHDRVIDVGCGPGLAVAYAAEATLGPVVGVDASETMVRHAGRRNRAAARQGRVEIRRADAARLPYPDAHFSKAGSLNSLQFWPSPEQGLAELYRVLEPGGRVAVVLMARSDDPEGPSSPPWIAETAARMEAAGFVELETGSRSFGGVLHRALVASRPEKKSGAPLDPTADGVRRGAAH